MDETGFLGLKLEGLIVIFGMLLGAGGLFVVWDRLRALRTAGASVIITTHYMDEAERLCDRLVVIDHGRIIALDTPNNFKKSLGGDIVTVKTKVPDLAELQKLKYIKIRKQFIDKKPNTSYFSTNAGKKAFSEHLDALETLIKKTSY